MSIDDMTEDQAMILVKSFIDNMNVQFELGIDEISPLNVAMEIVYNRAACNIGLEKIMSAKTDEESADGTN